jgi:hypothetical protein
MSKLSESPDILSRIHSEVFEEVMGFNFPQLQGPYPLTKVLPTENVFNPFSRVCGAKLLRNSTQKFPSLPAMTSVVYEFPNRKRF